MSFSKTLSEIASQGVTAAEFDTLDGVTTTTAELNALDVSEASGASATTFLRGDATWVAAGSTSATDLTSGTLPAARLPTGAILQVKGDTYTGATFNITTTAALANAGAYMEIEITCASTSNFLLINMTTACAYNHAASTYAFYAGFRYSTDNWSSPATGTNIASKDFPMGLEGYLDYNRAHHHNPSFHLYVAVPTTSTMKIQPWMKAQAGTYGIHVNNSSTQNISTLSVMEIQG